MLLCQMCSDWTAGDGPIGANSKQIKVGSRFVKIFSECLSFAYAYGVRILHGDREPDWLHEIKVDGYRMLVIRENDRVRLLNGSDRTNAIPGSLRPHSRTGRSIS
jgi:ATP-dependent DNA ligase